MKTLRNNFSKTIATVKFVEVNLQRLDVHGKVLHLAPAEMAGQVAYMLQSGWVEV